jgi:hypothetical protein
MVEREATGINTYGTAFAGCMAGCIGGCIGGWRIGGGPASAAVRIPKQARPRIIAETKNKSLLVMIIFFNPLP